MTVFEGNFAYSESIRLVGALWGGIFILSILGLFFPDQMRLVFLFQLVYESTWLLVAALPAYLGRWPFISRGHGPILYPVGGAAPLCHSLENYLFPVREEEIKGLLG